MADNRQINDEVELKDDLIESEETISSLLCEGPRLRTVGRDSKAPGGKIGIDLTGLGQVIQFMSEAGELKPPLPSAEKFVDFQYLHAAGIQ